jgi:manganese/zinc/iron transport system substrate-binding protein
MTKFTPLILTKTLLAFCFLPLTFCAFAQPLNVVTTVGMIADIIENVGADCVSVTALMGPGVDPHLYKASARDVHTLQYADVIFFSGYHLEGKMAEVLEALGKRKITVAVAEMAISESEMLASPTNASAFDPHVWMDVNQWAGTADVIAQTLAEASPDCANAPANARVYRDQLMALHDWIKTSIASIPEGQRVLVTAHDAFFYYSRAYAIEVAAIQGISTQAEASIDDVRQTVNIVVSREIPAIFVESSINPRTIEAVLQAVQDQGANTVIGGQLYSDALGQRGTADGTYIGMLYHNTKTITEALGGTIAPLPNTLQSWAEMWNL